MSMGLPLGIYTHQYGRGCTKQAGKKCQYHGVNQVSLQSQIKSVMFLFKTKSSCLEASISLSVIEEIQPCTSPAFKPIGALNVEVSQRLNWFEGAAPFFIWALSHRWRLPDSQSPAPPPQCFPNIRHCSQILLTIFGINYSYLIWQRSTQSQGSAVTKQQALTRFLWAAQDRGIYRIRCFSHFMPNDPYEIWRIHKNIKSSWRSKLWMTSRTMCIS